jgi:hypothetical protein
MLCEVVSEPFVYVTVKEPGVPVIPSPENVATPLESVAVPVPTTLPADSVAVTVPVSDVTVLPPASRTVTTGWVVKAVP